MYALFEESVTPVVQAKARKKRILSVSLSMPETVF